MSRTTTMPVRLMGHGHAYKGAQASSWRVGVFILLALLLALLLTVMLVLGQYQRHGATLDVPSDHMESRDRRLETEALEYGDKTGMSESSSSRSASDVSTCPPSAQSTQDLMPGWKPTVPSVVLRRGVAYEGDMLRMDQFLHKVRMKRGSRHRSICLSFALHTRASSYPIRIIQHTTTDTKF